MKFKLTIDMNNAAFAEEGELSAILRKLARRFDDVRSVARTSGILSDSNGNTVGEWSVR